MPECGDDGSGSNPAHFTLRLPALVKVILLGLTVWPCVWMVVFLTASDSDAEQTWFLVGHLWVIALIPLTLLVYALHILRNPELGNDRAVMDRARRVSGAGRQRHLLGAVLVALSWGCAARGGR